MFFTKEEDNMQLPIREREKNGSTNEMNGSGLVILKGSVTPNEPVRKGVEYDKVMYLPLENKILLNDCRVSLVGKEHGNIVPKAEENTKMAS